MEVSRPKTGTTSATQRARKPEVKTEDKSFVDPDAIALGFEPHEQLSERELLDLVSDPVPPPVEPSAPPRNGIDAPWDPAPPVGAAPVFMQGVSSASGDLRTPLIAQNQSNPIKSIVRAGGAIVDSLLRRSSTAKEDRPVESKYARLDDGSLYPPLHDKVTAESKQPFSVPPLAETAAPPTYEEALQHPGVSEIELPLAYPVQAPVVFHVRDAANAKSEAPAVVIGSDQLKTVLRDNKAKRAFNKRNFTFSRA